MLKDNLHEPFQLVLKEALDVCPRPEHRHSFFELVYIVSGTGKQRINDTAFPYLPGHLFLLAPGDAHIFQVDQPTQFFFIRFNNSFLDSVQGQPGLTQMLKNASHAPGCILKNESDKIIMKPMMAAIIREYARNDLYRKELIRQYVQTLLVIVARNLAGSLPENIDDSSEEKVVDILQYLQTNIHHPEKLRAAHISKYFSISSAYLGRYFKKHAQETMQQYITRYKLTLIEERLLHSNMRIAEIADEFGFTDKSHLNRIFKKYKGMNPGDLKKNKQDI